MVGVWILWASLLLASESKTVAVDLEVPVLNNDAFAARDQAQNLAFEKALDLTLPKDGDPKVRESRVKSAIRYIKSFRVTHEQRVGESLRISFEVEVQASAFEGLQPAPSPVLTPTPVPATATNEIGTNSFGPPPSSGVSESPRELVSLEIVFIEYFNAAEVVDQIRDQLKIPVKSFRLTRSAVLLRVEPIRPVDDLIQEIQAFVGKRGKVGRTPLETLKP